MSLYKDPIIQKVIDVITAGVGTNIKSYYHGDPLMIAKSDLPALLVSKDTTEVGDEENAVDYHKMTLVLTLVTDIRDSISDTPSNIHYGDQKLYDIFEGRNADFTLKSTAIVDILKKSANLGSNANIDMKSPMRVSYGFTMGKRGEKALAWEGYLTFNIYFVQLR